MLYITDRDYLLGQAKDNEFLPFGDARHRVLGEATTSRDIFFTTYQAIADNESGGGLLREYQPNFFDLIIVDECHRGSARQESNWRRVLDYFGSAIQLGMTATPLSETNADTYAYYGDPLLTYSLRAGINDGFLAPYRVHRVLLGEAAAAEAPSSPSSRAGTPAGDGADLDAAQSEEENEFPPDLAALGVETPERLRAATEKIADHLAAYLRRTDPLAKTMVFCIDQQHAADMRSAIERACEDECRRNPGYVTRIVSDEGMEGKRELDRFSTPAERTPVVVTTSKLLSTGVDVPTCKNIVLARPVGSMVEFKQIIGRGTRLSEPEKNWFTILDYAGASRHFFDEDFDGDPEVVEVEPLIPQPVAPEAIPGVVSTDGEPGQLRAIDRPATGDGSLGGEPAGSPVATPVTTTYPEIIDTTSTRDTSPAGTRKVADVSPLPEEQVQPYAPTEPPAGDTLPPIQRPLATGSPAGAEGKPADATGASSAGPPPESEVAEPSTAGDKRIPPERPPAEPPRRVQRARDGLMIEIVGEIVRELAPDGRTLRKISYEAYAREALRDLVASPEALVQDWLRRSRRDDLRALLSDNGLDLDALPAALKRPDLDPLDLLLKLLFGVPPLTRAERAERVRRNHAAFFERFDGPAREILRLMLDKYVAGEAPDITDTGLFKVPPLSDRGTLMELMRAFGGGTEARQALSELQARLYGSA